MAKLSWFMALAFAASTAAGADLATAQKQWENKQFDEAFRNFKVLAEQGVPAAQMQLGEMYGFGEGTAEDAQQAEQWLNKAIAAGQPEAKESLTLVRERQRRKSDIAAYTHHFTGEQFAYTSYHCARPTIPEASRTNEDIAATNAAINKWRDCYAMFAKRLNGALPATNTIPADVVQLMNNAEYQQASQKMESILAKLAAEGQVISDEVAAQSSKWAKNTAVFAGRTKTDQEVFLREQERALRSAQNERIFLPSK